MPTNSISATPKADGLTSCLNRISGIVGQLCDNNLRLIGLTNQICGSEPQKDQPESTPQPLPDNALFLARQIEQGLQQIVDTQRHQMHRIDNAIS